MVWTRLAEGSTKSSFSRSLRAYEVTLHHAIRYESRVSYRFSDLLIYLLECVLPYVDFPTKEPVFLKPDLTLIEPNTSAINLSDGEEIFIACPGKGNSLLINSKLL